MNPMTIQSLDTQLLLFINLHTTNALFDILMPALSLQGYLLVTPFLLAILARGSMTKNDRGKTYLVAAVWTILIACCAAYLAGWIEDWMKDAVARVRPCRAIEGIRLILPCPRSYSMPSGHAISSFAFAMPLFYLTRPYILSHGTMVSHRARVTYLFFTGLSRRSLSYGCSCGGLRGRGNRAGAIDPVSDYCH